MSLTSLSFQGAFWLGSLKLVIKLFSFIKLIVVARVLSPADIGWFGVVLLPYGLVEVMTESGISQALVQSQKNIKEYLSSAWLVLILRGIFIGGLLYLAAPFISRFYGQDLNLAIRVISLTPILKGFINPAIIFFRKELQFKKEFVYQSLASIAESLATIILVLKLRHLMALPWGVVLGGATALLGSFFLAKIYESKVSLAKIKELYGYGKWVTLGTLISYLNDQGDDFLVSKLSGAYALGLYQTAYKVANLPTTQGAGLIYQIIFPIFASIQTNKVRLKRGVIKALGATFLLSLAFCVVAFFAGPQLIALALGPVWLSMVPTLNVLLLFALTRPLFSVGSAVFDALGQPKIIAGINSIRLIVMLGLLYPLTKLYGPVGTAWAVVIAQLAIYPAFLSKLKKILSV